MAMKNLKSPKQEPIKVGRTIPDGDGTVTYYYYRHERNGRTYYSRWKLTVNGNGWRRFSSKSFAVTLDAKRWEASESKLLKTLS